ncbi:uncharacterized protein HMPREF1541_00726 [Cyphellophora europaea CBS 101466]|uniref:BZIP domain-containing protein n=1 Tax=Cyphellophora europaea (strain CBS 101466) TaxID=1220924 RepID=W2SCU3_CYPE1|nr:uncharacterized protein HMPREF1541_00726 [Cyphellophora europaea CBS 101466]ETN46541.1 hypothetical protein HMPREF1541_00726 [Cyphellophora europaea CBS 101466]
MSESGSEQSKVEKKSREYNRNAQRVFRQRRKEHLTKLEQAQREANSLQSEEVERLRRENQALLAENETLRASYGSQTSSPGPSISPRDVRASPSNYLPYGPPAAFLAAAATTTPVSTVPVPGSASTMMQDTGNLVVVMPNNIQEIRRSLHRLFAPLLDIPVISNPRSHLATLQAMQPTLPTSLKPTALQLSTPHHAYIDMIPSATLRDRLVAVGATHANAFLMEVCTLACEIDDTGQMTIWGEDWLNEFSWEFSALALERYGGWLLTAEWGQRANFWRRQRGAPILPGYD